MVAANTKKKKCAWGAVAWVDGESQIWGPLMSLFGVQLCVCLWRLKSIRNLLGVRAPLRLWWLRASERPEWPTSTSFSPRSRGCEAIRLHGTDCLERPGASKHAVQPSPPSRSRCCCCCWLQKDLEETANYVAGGRINGFVESKAWNLFSTREFWDDSFFFTNSFLVACTNIAEHLFVKWANIVMFIDQCVCSTIISNCHFISY